MKKILLVVDLQNDFLSQGPLAVKNGEKIIPLINSFIHSTECDYVIATQDWHPFDHLSFADTHGLKPLEEISTIYGQQTLWPVHCVSGTHGAEFHKDFDTHGVHFIIRKGFRRTIDSYSAFYENDKRTPTGLHGLISCLTNGNVHLFIAGIALDVCVFHTAMDAKKMLKYPQITVCTPLCAAINEDSAQNSLKSMFASGIQVLL